MKMKIYVMLAILVLILLLISCMTVITTAPRRRNFTQSLESFPTSDLPLKDAATIYWDSYLIPFIETNTDQDCAFLMGMVHAHLRQTQMTLICRVVEGRLASADVNWFKWFQWLKLHKKPY